jgi:hypothetical protein
MKTVVRKFKIFYRKLDKTLVYVIIAYVCLNFGLIYFVREYPEFLRFFSYHL